MCKLHFHKIQKFLQKIKGCWGWQALCATPTSRGRSRGQGHCKFFQATWDYTARPGLQIQKEVKREKEMRNISGKLSSTPKFGGEKFRGEREL